MPGITASARHQVPRTVTARCLRPPAATTTEIWRITCPPIQERRMPKCRRGAHPGRRVAHCGGSSGSGSTPAVVTLGGGEADTRHDSGWT